jgi:hypothetical protein
MTFSNGEKYTGFWKNDQMEGNGLYLFTNGKSIEGKWSNGILDGEALCTGVRG